HHQPAQHTEERHGGPGRTHTAQCAKQEAWPKSSRRTNDQRVDPVDAIEAGEQPQSAGTTQHRQEDEHTVSSFQNEATALRNMRTVHQSPSRFRVRPRNRHTRPTGVVKRKVNGDPPSPADIATPTRGRPLRTIAVVRGPVVRASASARCSSCSVRLSASWSTTLAGPAPASAATSQHTARQANAHRSGSSSAAVRKEAESEIGPTGEPAWSTESLSASSGGCPARSSVARTRHRVITACLLRVPCPLRRRSRHRSIRGGRVRRYAASDHRAQEVRGTNDSSPNPPRHSRRAVTGPSPHG